MRFMMHATNQELLANIPSLDDDSALAVPADVAMDPRTMLSVSRSNIAEFQSPLIG